MTWRRVGLYWLLFGILFLAYRATTESDRAPQEVPSARVALVDLPESQIAEVRLLRRERVVRCRREMGYWKVVDPAGARVPADLLASFITTMTEAWAKEVIEGGAEDLESYGLGAESLRVELYPQGHERPISVQLGGRNPTETALYARVGDSPEVLVVGRVLGYYARRIFEEVDARSSRRRLPAIDEDRVPSTG